MQFLTEHEIFQDLLLYKLLESDKVDFKALGEDDLITLHHSFGMWIRNEYKMWHNENPHFKCEDARGDMFPDQVSQRIIEKLWCRLNDTFISTRCDIVEENGTYKITKYFVDENGNRTDSRPTDGRRNRTIKSLAEMLAEDKPVTTPFIEPRELQELKGNFRK